MLTETWLEALQLRVEADLRTGRHGPLIAELRKLTATYPLREKLHGQLMTALYLNGRQAEALASFRRLRELLSEELGIMPCRDLQELHQRMLNGEAILADPASNPSSRYTRQVSTTVINRDSLEWLLPGDGAGVGRVSPLHATLDGSRR